MTGEAAGTGTESLTMQGRFGEPEPPAARKRAPRARTLKFRAFKIMGFQPTKSEAGEDQ